MSGLGQSAAFLPSASVLRAASPFLPKLTRRRHSSIAYTTTERSITNASRSIRRIAAANATAAEPVAASNTTTLINRRRAARQKMIEVICNDRLGKKIRVKCNEDDTIGDLKKLVAAQSGTRPEKIRIQKWYTIFKDHITLEDYEIHDGMGLELYYN